MNFDLRLPLGLIFSLFGAILGIDGLVGDRAVYARSLGLDVNLIWGGVILVFGLAMLGSALRTRAKGGKAKDR